MVLQLIRGYLKPSTGGTIYLHNVSEATNDGVQISTENDLREAVFRPTIEARTLDDDLYWDLLECVGNDDDGDPILIELHLWDDEIVAENLVLIDSIEHHRFGDWHVVRFTLEPFEASINRTGLLAYNGTELKLENISEDVDDGVEILSNSVILLSGKKNIQVSGDTYFAPAIEMRTEDLTAYATLLSFVGIEDDGTPKKLTLTLYDTVYSNMVLTGQIRRKRYKKWQVIAFQLEQQTA